MRSPRLADLPSAPPCRSGWPWTEDSPQLPDVARGDEDWPRITIVTPSLNQAAYLEETIRSVLLQGYPDFEYFVVDGGSTDGCGEIIAKYSPWLAYWVSEPDKGQSDALNKGFARATGQVFGYVNSDDLYVPEALGTIAPYFLETREPCLVAGECLVFRDGQRNRTFAPWWPASLAHLLEPFGSTFAQPSSFWSRSLHERVGGFDADLQFVFDREFFLKLGLQGVAPLLISSPISRYRDHPATKTSQTIKFYEESSPLIQRYASRCGLDATAAAALLHDCRDEIRYLNTFACWRHKGRAAALAFFLHAVLRSPRILAKRKVLGLARRLLCFPSEAVAELRNV
jgi:glycosyltransferase involved in cell wall biosynthesis